MRLFCTLSLGGACSSNGMPSLRAEAGSRPACESLSFASPKERNQRKGDPTVCVPAAARRGNLRCSGLAGSRSNSLRFTSLRQSRALIRQTLRSSAHPEGQGSRTSTRAIAALGPNSRAQAPRAAQTGPSAAMARMAVRLFGCSAAPPLLAAPAAGRLRGEHGRRSAHASLTNSPWMSERRAQRKASSTAHPATDTPQVCPFAPRRGRRLGVAFLLGTFLWRSKEKYLARRGDSRPPPSPQACG